MPAGDVCNPECAFEGCNFDYFSCVKFAGHEDYLQFRFFGSLTGDRREACAQGATADMITLNTARPLRELYFEALSALVNASAFETNAARTKHENEMAPALDPMYFLHMTLSFPYANLENEASVFDYWDTEHYCFAHPRKVEPDIALWEHIKTHPANVFRQSVVSCHNTTHYAARVVTDINNRDTVWDADFARENWRDGMQYKDMQPDGEELDLGNDGATQIFREFLYHRSFTPCAGGTELVWNQGGACESDVATCGANFETREDQLHARKFRVPNYGPHTPDGEDPGALSNLLPLAVSGRNVADFASGASAPTGETLSLTCAACTEGSVARSRMRIADSYCHGAYILLPTECVQCPHAENCANSECVVGHDYMTMCETCLTGFYKSGTKCKPCGARIDWLKEYPVTLLCFLIIFSGFCKWMYNQGREPISNDMVIGHLQLLAIFFTSFDGFTWPPIFAAIMDWVATFFDLNFNFALCPSPQENPVCTKPMGRSWLILSPWFFGLVYGGWYLIQSNRSSNNGTKKDKEASDSKNKGGEEDSVLRLLEKAGAKVSPELASAEGLQDATAMSRIALLERADGLTRAIVKASFFFYIPVLKAALLPFDCYKYPGTDEKVMEADTRIKCTWSPQSKEEAEYGQIAAISAAVAAGVGFGFPMLYGHKLYQAHKRGNLYSATFLRRYGGMHIHFAQGQFYWGLVLFMKKALIAYIAIFSSKSDETQKLLLIIPTFMTFILHVVVRPYDGADKTSALTNLAAQTPESVIYDLLICPDASSKVRPVDSDGDPTQKPSIWHYFDGQGFFIGVLFASGAISIFVNWVIYSCRADCAFSWFSEEQKWMPEVIICNSAIWFGTIVSVYLTVTKLAKRIQVPRAPGRSGWKFVGILVTPNIVILANSILFATISKCHDLDESDPKWCAHESDAQVADEAYQLMVLGVLYANVFLLSGVAIGVMFGLHLGVVKAEHRRWQRELMARDATALRRATQSHHELEAAVSRTMASDTAGARPVGERMRRMPSKLDGLAIGLDLCELTILLGAWIEVAASKDAAEGGGWGGGGATAIDIATVASVAAVCVAIGFTLRDQIAREPDAMHVRFMLWTYRKLGGKPGPAAGAGAVGVGVDDAMHHSVALGPKKAAETRAALGAHAKEHGGDGGDGVDRMLHDEKAAFAAVQSADEAERARQLASLEEKKGAKRRKRKGTKKGKGKSKSKGGRKSKKGRVSLVKLKQAAQTDEAAIAAILGGWFFSTPAEDRRRNAHGRKRKSARVAHKASVFTALEDEANAMARDGDLSATHCTKSDYSGREVAVLVSDLSGFTSMTRKYGITHFASIIVRMRQLVLPSFHRYDVMDVATEGDNFIVAFPDAVGATLAAFEMQQVILKYNAGLAEARAHYAINLNGVAVACGEDVIVDTENKMHGVVFQEAYEMGEDLCDGGIVLVTEKVMDRCKGSAQHADAFKACPWTEHGKSEHSRNFLVENLDVGAGRPFPVKHDDMRFLPEALGPFAARHDPNKTDDEIQVIDEHVDDMYSNQYTVVMFDIFEHDVAEEHGATRALVAGHEMLHVIRPIVAKHHGVGVEEALYIFKDAAKAVACMVELRAACHAKAAERADDWNVKVTGYGAHSGTLLFVQGTDLHWGDPVNTASKLGEDIAEDEDILITVPVYEALGGPEFDGCLFAPQKFIKSKVEMIAFSVLGPGEEPPPSRAAKVLAGEYKPWEAGRT